MNKPIATAFILGAATMMAFAGALAQDSTATPAAAAPAAKTAHAAAAKTHQADTLATPKAKTSYAIGMNLGATFKGQSIDVDPNILLRGLKDSLAGGKTLLTEEEVRATLMELQGNVRKAQVEKMQQLAGKNKAEGNAFMAANKTKEGVVTLPSGLQYKILAAGTGPKPLSTDSVSVNYKGTLLDGTEFDSSYKRGKPTTFPVGGIIKGWSEALELMPVGSKWQLFIPESLAYGDRGAGGAIPPNATLIFEVELLSIQNPTTSANPNASPDKK